jgi:aryl-alcohol dehydrogenase-like predicted oxidoreductase
MLGRSTLELSPIGLGVMQFAGGKGMFKAMFPTVPEDVRSGIIRNALDGGINWFDTAELYGGGQSERYLAEALQEVGAPDGEFVIATKWSPFLRTANNIPRTIHERIAQLQPYPIGLYQVHNPWSFSSPEAEMKAMADLVDMELIQVVGVSNFDPEQMRRAHKALADRGIPLASNQVQYNLLHREIENDGILETARELGIAIIAWSPLASGILTGKFHRHPEILENTPAVRRRRLAGQLEKSEPIIEVLEEIAAVHEREPAQVALSWLIHQGEDIFAIPGASRVDHVQESVGAMELKLSDAELTELDQISAPFK